MTLTIGTIRQLSDALDNANCVVGTAIKQVDVVCAEAAKLIESQDADISRLERELAEAKKEKTCVHKKTKLNGEIIYNSACGWTTWEENFCDDDTHCRKCGGRIIIEEV